MTFPASLDGFALPAGFRFGVATAGFQVEGGYNGAGDPANNWAAWEQAGRVEPSGIAVNFWDEFELHLDRAVAAGCDAFRMSVEWARCEPAPGEIDGEALAHYGRILDACAARGLEPLVSLHHFAHPAWLGTDFWLQPDAPQRFAAWTATAIGALGSRCRAWVTINEPNVLALLTYFNGVFPPGRRFDRSSLATALDHLLTGHVLAYALIKERHADAIVATNTYSFSSYEPDRLLIDVLGARAHGVERVDVRGWLRQRRDDYHRQLGAHGPAERAMRAVSALALPIDKAFSRTIDAVYECRFDTTIDVTQLDWYDPRVDRKFRMPGHRTAGGRNWLPGRMLWDDPPDPPGLTRYCRLNHETGKDVWVVENGLCNRVRGGVSHPRLDGWNRIAYLEAHLAAVVEAVRGGVPVTAYYHWSLVDNYEWGSYEPRFGLYGIDRQRGVRWLETDAMGDHAAAAYARLINALRAGEVGAGGRAGS